MALNGMQRSPERLQFWVDKDIRRRSVNLTIFYEGRRGGDGGNAVAYCKPLEVVVIPEGDETSPPIEPTVRLPYDDAEGLMLALWNAGVRPSEIESSDGELDAINRHITTLKHTIIDLKEQITFFQRLVEHQVGLVADPRPHARLAGAETGRTSSGERDG